MFAMQYSFLLPADYDMGIIDRRIADRGHTTDGFGGLRFKAYLIARRSGGSVSSHDNFYAPFYVWNTAEGFNNFVCGDGFGAPSKAFGRPQVKTWMVWTCQQIAEIATAKFATRGFRSIEPSDDLGVLREQADDRAKKDLASGALAAVYGFEPTGWTEVRFQLWRSLPPLKDVQSFEVAHLSLP